MPLCQLSHVQAKDLLMWDWDSIRQTSDGYCSVYDLLRVVDGAKNPREEWRRLTQKFPWLAERLDIRYMQFVGEGERPTPVIDTEGLHLLQGLMMRQHRARAAQHLESALKCLATLMQRESGDQQDNLRQTLRELVELREGLQRGTRPSVVPPC